jgi:hypothetical protein
MSTLWTTNEAEMSNPNTASQQGQNHFGYIATTECEDRL